MNREQLIATTNPEVLLVDAGDLDELAKLDAKRLAASKLASTLAELSVASLASLVRKLEGEGSTLAVNEYLVENIKKKVFEATPDQLSVIIEEAKQLRVWYAGYGIKEAVMERNRQLAKLVGEYTNIEALDNALQQMSRGTQDEVKRGWLPRPVYDAAKKAILSMIPGADMHTLNRIGDVASDWRMRDPSSINPAIRKRDHEILEEAGLGYNVYPKGASFVVANGTKKFLVEKRRKVLGLLDSGHTIERVIA